MKVFFKFTFLFVVCTGLTAQQNIPLASFEHIPDSTELRKSIADTWFFQDIEKVKELEPAEYTDGTGKRFSVESNLVDDVLEVRITPYDTDFFNNKKLKKAINADELKEQKEQIENNNLENIVFTDITENTEQSIGENIDKKESKESKKESTEKFESPFESPKEENVKVLPKNLVPTSFTKTHIPQGTWVLRRDVKTGNPISITIYLRENSDLFVVLHPAKLERIKDKSLVDFCLFSAYVRRDVPVSLSFEQLYYTSLVDLKKRSEKLLPWKIFDPPVVYSTVEATSKIVAKNMKKLVYMDGGMFDENGVAINALTGKKQTKNEIKYAAEMARLPGGQKIIAGVDNFGFVKWIIDGIIRPIAGSCTYIKAHTKASEVPITSFNESYVKKRSLFSGLDWIRNLGAARLSLTMKKTVYPNEAGLDVNVEPFSFSLPAANSHPKAKKFAGYFRPAGYQIEYLKALMYYLAIMEPGNFYLVSVSKETGNPALRQYNSVAALFPYFDLLGNFHVDVYKDAKSISLENFIQANINCFTALVRVKAPEIGFFKP